ncbi:MAG: tripartite tricarboxylate transporter TctB family protein [Alphaproteobacteria bacterium]|nr:tripartite tricarboxylate transporter TctB family protein [Alphaproteobacteria bacterium]
MRLAELVMAVVMAIFSVYLMWKSSELPVGWIPKSGPGGGAFPFWLGTGMLACCAWIVVRWARRLTPASRSDRPYMDHRTLQLFLIGAGSLTAMIGLIHVVGVYISVPLYLIFYLRWIGHHPWRLAGGIGAVTPVVTFFFFEIALKIELPKGMAGDLFLNDWVYYPLYDIFL